MFFDSKYVEATKKGRLDVTSETKSRPAGLLALTDRPRKNMAVHLSSDEVQMYAYLQEKHRNDSGFEIAVTEFHFILQMTPSRELADERFTDSP